METVLLALSVTWALFSPAYLVYTNRGKLRFAGEVWKSIHRQSLLAGIGIAFGVLGSLQLLEQLFPILKWGWPNLVAERGSQIAIAPFAEGLKTQVPFLRLLLLFGFVLMTLAAPFLAKLEETMYRAGCYEWNRLAGKSLISGALLFPFGVSLAAIMSFTLLAFFFAYLHMRTRKDKNMTVIIINTVFKVVFFVFLTINSFLPDLLHFLGLS